MQKATDKQIQDAMLMFSEGASYDQVSGKLGLTKNNMYRIKNITDDRIKKIADKVGYKVPSNEAEPIQTRVLNLLKRESDLSCSDICNRVGIGKVQAHGAVYRLIEAGLVAQNTTSKPTRYSIKKSLGVNDVMRAISICWPLAKTWQESKAMLVNNKA